MKLAFRNLLLGGLLLPVVALLSAATLEDQGKAWLEQHKDPAQINVSGTWDSEFGIIQLDQTKDGRDVTGHGGGYDLDGVVSGKTLFVLFVTKHGTIDYCGNATLVSDTSLIGEYQNRVSRLRFGAGESVCQTKERLLHLTKK